MYVRSAIIGRAAAALADHADVLAELLCAEIAKPVQSARAEVARTVSTLELCAVEARKLTGHTVPMDATAVGEGKFAATLPVPVGVVAAITPFNFPLNLACHKVGPAIAAGCGVVLKPADKAPLTACLLADLFAEAGLPSGWLNIIVGEPVAIAQTFADDRRVGLITFTGSAAIGWELRARAPRKRVTLELGNATPVIVDQVSDPHVVGRGLAASAFAFSGQSCISAQRVFAHASIARELADGLAARAAELQVGDPADPLTEIGPLITPDSTARVLGVVEEAAAGGAVVLSGGEQTGSVLRPTVLAGSPADATILQREVFGPVVTVEPFSDFDAALAAANNTEYGLQASVYTNRLDRMMAAAAQLDFASVLINEIPSFRADQMPYGGIKNSGNSREGPAYAIREMTEERLIVLSGNAGVASNEARS